jgi:hypothetical protein
MNCHYAGAIRAEGASRGAILPNWASTHSTDGIIGIEDLIGLSRSDLIDAQPLFEGLITRITTDDRRQEVQGGGLPPKPIPTNCVTDSAVQLDDPVVK